MGQSMTCRSWLPQCLVGLLLSSLHTPLSLRTGLRAEIGFHHESSSEDRDEINKHEGRRVELGEFLKGLTPLAFGYSAATGTSPHFGGYTVTVPYLAPLSIGEALMGQLWSEVASVYLRALTPRRGIVQGSKTPPPPRYPFNIGQGGSPRATSRVAGENIRRARQYQLEPGATYIWRFRLIAAPSGDLPISCRLRETELPWNISRW